jgi:hypothetical protein
MVDLMPASCRERLGRKSRVRAWALRYAGVAAVLAVLIIATEVREQSWRLRVADLQEQVDFTVEQRRKADVISAKITTIEEALAQHERLALPLAATKAIETVADATPESVTFTTLAMTPKLVRHRSIKPGEPGSEERLLLFELRGLAPSDTDLAQLVAAIETNPLFTTASIDYTSQTDVYGREARDFGVTCEISLERDFVFAGETAP